MLFSSSTFVFLFLPLVCIVYLIVRQELKNYVLLISSLIFYGWGEPRYLAIMLITILLNYVGAFGISRYRNQAKLILTGTILCNLAILFYFKYFNFLLENINSIFHANVDFIQVIMPIGISFYTFQATSYLIDVYRKEVRVQHNIYKLALYITLFPQLVAGPIVKYHDVEKQISNREIRADKIAYGIKRFIIGFAKKMLLANTMASIADSIFNQDVSTIGPGVAWVGALAYSMQLFFDFSGYSDMAIGLGHIFGFKFLENFNYPYISRSITEFWRRWHMSLSTWFREYLYIPLGGNRVSPCRLYVNLFIVFLATGIWHGASWTFIVWGMWHGLFIVFERITGWHKTDGGAVIKICQHIYAILIFVTGWVIFRADSIGYATAYITKMWSAPPLDTTYSMAGVVGPLECVAFCMCFLCSTPFAGKLVPLNSGSLLHSSLVNTWLIVLFVLSAANLAATTYNPFIYFRF